MAEYESSRQPGLPGLPELPRRRFLVRRADGRLQPFEPARVVRCLQAAFLCDQGREADSRLDAAVESRCWELAEGICHRVIARALDGEEAIPTAALQELIEEELMRHGYFSVARSYILCRHQRGRKTPD